MQTMLHTPYYVNLMPLMIAFAIRSLTIALAKVRSRSADDRQSTRVATTELPFMRSFVSIP